MAVPKHRTSKQKKRMRRSHHKIVPPSISVCKSCNIFKRNHFACLSCEKTNQIKRRSETKKAIENSKINKENKIAKQS